VQVSDPLMEEDEEGKKAKCVGALVPNLTRAEKKARERKDNTLMTLQARGGGSSKVENDAPVQKEKTSRGDRKEFQNPQRVGSVRSKKKLPGPVKRGNCLHGAHHLGEEIRNEKRGGERREGKKEGRIQLI